MVKLLRDIALEELDEYDEYDDSLDYRTVRFFEEGIDVEVIKEVKPNDQGDRLFIIYSPELNEATVVNECYLEGYDK